MCRTRIALYAVTPRTLRGRFAYIVRICTRGPILVTDIVYELLDNPHTSIKKKFKIHDCHDHAKNCYRKSSKRIIIVIVHYYHHRYQILVGTII